MREVTKTYIETRFGHRIKGTDFNENMPGVGWLEGSLKHNGANCEEETEFREFKSRCNDAGCIFCPILFN